MEFVMTFVFPAAIGLSGYCIASRIGRTTRREHNKLLHWVDKALSPRWIDLLFLVLLVSSLAFFCIIEFPPVRVVLYLWI